MTTNTLHQRKKLPLKVGDFMSAPVTTAHPSTSLVDAVQLMILKGIANIAVVDGEKVDGILTERELLQYLVLNKAIPNKEIRYVLTQKFAKVTPETSIADAARTMITKKARLLVFVKDERVGTDNLAGIITSSDIVRAYLKTGRNPSIESSIANKVVTITPESTILSAAKLMLKKKVGSVIVSANAKEERGGGGDSKPSYAIFTERDILNKVLGEHVDIEESVGRYSSYPLVTAKLGIGAKQAGKLMISNKIKRLPLTQRGRIVAIVTARDLVEAFQKEQR